MILRSLRESAKPEVRRRRIFERAEVMASEMAAGAAGNDRKRCWWPVSRLQPGLMFFATSFSWWLRSLQGSLL